MRLHGVSFHVGCFSHPCWLQVELSLKKLSAFGVNSNLYVSCDPFYSRAYANFHIGTFERLHIFQREYSLLNVIYYHIPRT